MYHLIERVHLYVEKYANGNMLLDFIAENEFIYFKNNGDYVDNMKLRQYEATMLCFRNVKNLHITEGDIISVSMQTLISHKENTNKFDFSNTQEHARPYHIHMFFNDSGWFEDLFRSGEAFKDNRKRKQLINYIEGTWPNGTPCSLNKISNEIDVEVVDVAQGSTNLIYSNNALTIFDFGTSMLASESELKRIVDETLVSADLHNASLIISHWDIDHYNLITVLDEQWLEQFCCVFFPAEVITLTSKQVVNRLLQKCHYIRTFQSPTAIKRGNVGIIPVIENRNYTLYVGEKSRDTNKSGLALVIKSTQDITIFGADHTNKQIWEHIYPNIRPEHNGKINVIVPHHGGRCGKINLCRLSGKPGIAVISVGKNTYKHPDQSTIDAYDNLGFDVKRTDWERKNIYIQMK